MKPTYTYQKSPSDIFGLEFIPTPPIMGDFGTVINIDIGDDYPSGHGYGDYSFNIMETFELENSKVKEISEIFKNTPINILDIGIFNSRNGGFSAILSTNKNPESIYVGIDIEDKKAHENHSKRIFTIRSSSYEQDSIRKQLETLGVKNLSILMIDAHHSVKACINDWKYADLVVPGGKVIFHDTNCHPGPKILLDAIDRNLFEVDKCLENQHMWGISVATRK